MSPAAALRRACSGLRAPGMTVETPGCCQTQAMAAWAGVRSWFRAEPASSVKRAAASTPTSNGTPEKVSPTSKALPSRLNVRWSSSENVVSWVYRPDRSPDASGTRAMMPTPAAEAAGSTRSRGLSRNALRMICTVATPGRAMAVRASSTVSTETP